MANKDLNRLKVVLVEQHKTAKWLAEQMEKDPATISKWCTNKAQPSLETIKKIAEILQVKMSDLVINLRLTFGSRQTCFVQEVNSHQANTVCRCWHCCF